MARSPCRLRTHQAEERDRELPTLRKTFKDKRFPTAEQEGTLALVVRRWRELDNAALQERREAWRLRRVSLTRASPSAHLPESKQARPESQAIHAPVVQEVLTRLERAFPACFRRVTAGQTRGSPRCRAGTRDDSCTDKQCGNGAALDHGLLVLSQLGRLAVGWSRPRDGTPKTGTIRREADGWYACCSCGDVPLKPLPLMGQETAIDLGVESFATLANGEPSATPRSFRVWEMRLKRAQRRVARRVRGSHRRRKAVQLLAKAHQQVRRARQDFHHKSALAQERAGAALPVRHSLS